MGMLEEGIRYCARCKYKNVDVHEPPCRECFKTPDHESWEPVEREADPKETEKEDPEEAERGCETCAYRYAPQNAGPCSRCDGYELDKWVFHDWRKQTQGEAAGEAILKEIMEGMAKMGKPVYQQRIEERIAAQVAKGREKYGVTLEDNVTLTEAQRIEHLEEELIDGLMYCEHLAALGRERGITADDYQRAALRTAQADRLSADELLLNGVMGLCGEAGECIDLVKKARFQGHELDREKLAEELGDVAWYLAVAAHGLGIPLSSILEGNVEKLMKRYPGGFDKARSMNRAE